MNSFHLSRSWIFHIGILALLGTLSSEQASADLLSFQKKCNELIKNSQHQTDSSRLHHLLQLSWDESLKDKPERSTALGISGNDAFWADLSEKKRKEIRAKLQLQKKALQTIRTTQLNATDQLNRELFEEQLKAQEGSLSYPDHLLPIFDSQGPQHSIPYTLQIMPKNTKEDYENRIRRLAAVPLLIDQTLLLLKQGLKAQITPPQSTLEKVGDQIQVLTSSSFEKNPLFESFRSLPSHFSEETKGDLFKEAKKNLLEKAIPAFQKLHAYWIKEYFPRCRSTLRWENLPHGRAWYTFLVKQRTTTEESPLQIHQIGLQEVARIEKEISELLKAAHFSGTRQDYFRKLAQEPQTFYNQEKDLLEGYRKLSSIISQKLPFLFETRPQLASEIQLLPNLLKKSQPPTSYEMGSALTQRPGIFFIDASDLKNRPRWEMKALLLHELLPGHHFQMALAQESTSLPDFRKYSLENTAFMEGWALYAEKLGHEMGLYQEDLPSHLGQLSLELWHATRLVVETGLHSQNWTWEQAVSYSQEHSLKSLSEITSEIERSLAFPGKALACKWGELKFTELKNLAKKSLGPSFFIQKFHSAILQAGAMPLSVLEGRIQKSMGTFHPPTLPIHPQEE